MKFRHFVSVSLGILALAACTKQEIAKAPASVKFADSELTLDAAGETKTLTVKTSCSWTLESDAAWLKVAPASGNESTTKITIELVENTAETPRSASLILKAVDASVSATLPIIQKGKYVQPENPDPGQGGEPEDDGSIKTADAFKDFLASAADAESVKIGADIDMGGAVLTPAGSFSGVLDGQNHKIYNYKVESTAGTAGLFLLNKGTIRDLVLGSSDGKKYDGKSSVSFAESVEAFGHIGGVCAENAGTLDNVINFATVKGTFTSALTGVGGLVGMTQSESLITNCKNYSSVEAGGTMSAESYLAGVIAYVNSADAVISECSNEADLEITAQIKKASMFGGVVGRANKGAKIIKCTNNGDITYTQKETAGNYIMIAGVAGAVYQGSSLIECKNTGAITSTLQQVSRIGGVCGTLNTDCTIKDCVNTGAVTINQAEANANWEAAGGICGFQEKGSENEISGCTNSGAITIKVENATTHANKVAAGGIIGTAALSLSIANNTNTGKVTIENKAAGACYAGGIAGFLRAGAGLATSANVNSADVSCATSDNAVCGAGGIVGRSEVTSNTHTGDKSVANITCGNAANCGAVAGFSAGSIKDAKIGGKVNGETVTSANLETLVQGTASNGAKEGITLAN